MDENLNSFDGIVRKVIGNLLTVLFLARFEKVIKTEIEIHNPPCLV